MTLRALLKHLNVKMMPLVLALILNHQTLNLIT